MKNRFTKFLDQVHAARVRLLVSLAVAGLFCGLPVGPVTHWLFVAFIIATAAALSASETYRLRVATRSYSGK
ncbi:hypothetical protein WJ41_35170 [Burkholderia ubonensis]|uniref:hypothetical protein n=1 Tax=Burkholderia ubonensis TaxID=101571 RepID=UPI00075696C4|nr:hypothetical protein [Burkholderia ubonensis]KVH78753.1 hypothetical protein WJ41_35170 [Burkholderia ubonensis]KVT98644.1 hypothetical protein WK61_09445 [Burkholderia ubonensis]